MHSVKEKKKGRRLSQRLPIRQYSMIIAGKKTVRGLNINGGMRCLFFLTLGFPQNRI